MNRSARDLAINAAPRDGQSGARQIAGMTVAEPNERIWVIVALLGLGAILGTMLIGWIVDLCPPPWVVLGTRDKRILNDHWDYPIVGFVVTMSFAAAALMIWREFRLVRPSELDDVGAPRSRRGPLVATAGWGIAFAAVVLAAPLGHHDVVIVPPDAAAAAVQSQ